MEEKKNNKGIVWLIIILIVLILGLIGYIVYDKVVLNNNSINKNEENNTTTITNEKNNIEKEVVINSEELVCNSNEKCDIKKIGNIKVSIEKIVDSENLSDYYLLYINDKAIENKDELKNNFIYQIILLDDSHIFVEFSDLVGDSAHYIYNSDSKVIYDMRKITLVEDAYFQNISYENDMFIINTTNYLGDYAFSVCKYNKNDIVKSEEKFKYLGNGELSERKVILTKTSDDIIHEIYGMSCEEIKNSTSAELEYARENIKSYENN